jgi:hypothetical protein
MLVHEILGNLSLPLVSVRKKLFLIVEQLFMPEGEVGEGEY